ncbi:MAG: DUF721 domain-containing protein [Desulfohalobiaceae bacterium]|nr:DUF721 domain-containing protein [Desulfohalobiaceae bacterium]
MRTAAQALEALLSRRGMKQEMQIAEVWKQWPRIIGPGLQDLVRPVGKRKRTLRLGAANSLIMQECSLYSEQILDKIAACLGWQPFDKISFELLENKVCLDQVFVGCDFQTYTAAPPEILGGLLDAVPEDSPVGSCYRTYLRMLRKKVPLQSDEQ